MDQIKMATEIKSTADALSIDLAKVQGGSKEAKKIAQAMNKKHPGLNCRGSHVIGARLFLADVQKLVNNDTVDHRLARSTDI